MSSAGPHLSLQSVVWVSHGPIISLPKVLQNSSLWCFSIFVLHTKLSNISTPHRFFYNPRSPPCPPNSCMPSEFIARPRIRARFWCFVPLSRCPRAGSVPRLPLASSPVPRGLRFGLLRLLSLVFFDGFILAPSFVISRYHWFRW